MSLDINIEQPSGTTRILVPLDIPTVLINSGAVEVYAQRKCGWKPTITVDGVEVENPVNAITAAANDIRITVKEIYRQIAEDVAAEQARVQVRDQFSQVFGNQ